MSTLVFCTLIIAEIIASLEHIFLKATRNRLWDLMSKKKKAKNQYKDFNNHLCIKL